MLDDGVVDGFGQQFAQHFASDLALVASADDGSGRVSGTKAGNLRCLAVLAADTIVSAAYLGRFKFDSDLLASWRDVNEFVFHLLILLFGAKGGTRTPTPFGTRS